MLKLDNGEEYQYSAFWCGQFEILYGVKVEFVKDKNLEINYKKEFYEL